MTRRTAAWAIGAGGSCAVIGIANGVLDRSRLSVGIGAIELLVGIAYVAVAMQARHSSALFGDSSGDFEMTLDGGGIVAIRPARLRVRWTNVVRVRDVGQAFVVYRRIGRPIPVLKRALPKNGVPLAAALAASLERGEYVVDATP